MMNQEQVHELRAVEALRAGVPNRDVVRLLEPHQNDVAERFEALLDATTDTDPDATFQEGLLLEGDFGTGKSHWLERLRHVALQQNFVCSSVVINKETPLHSLDKIYRAAVEEARLPDKSGSALSEIAHTYSAENAPGYGELFDWVRSHATLDPRFQATLHLFQRSTDEELKEKIIGEWMGQPMYVNDLKAALKELGETAYKIERPQRDQQLLRFEFLTRFFRSAGYAGWVLLLDESEMVSKYTIRQRGQAYAHLAQLMGLEKKNRVPGLACVFTITKDYAGQVLHGRKNDLVNVPAKLEGRREEPCIPAAQIGMRAIQKNGIDLRPPTPAQIEDIYQRARKIYGEAYSWDAPELQNRREYSISTGLREYLRSWINGWDLRRLYNYDSDTVAEKLTMSYDEDKDLQKDENESDAPDGEPFVTL